ncbi:MAG: hypothetical protein IJR51_08195 [Clostridia bacterium]|nr:hypothetical protein [Clostridia bacterium]MBQ9507121.1 hypothetical protein [Clostridia bacterium]MBR5423926.1 hypothetical protein [Clostridia bacterium]
MAKITNRFVRIHKEGNSLSNEGYRQLIVDKETGVTYLLISCGYGTSITPLLKADGAPVITRIS